MGVEGRENRKGTISNHGGRMGLPGQGKEARWRRTGKHQEKGEKGRKAIL